MKLTIALLIISFSAFAQDSTTYLKDDKLYTQSGYVIEEKQMVKIGTGTMPDGDFKYIRIAATSLMQYSGNNRSAVNSSNSLPGRNRGYEYKVVRIDKRGTKKRGYNYYPVINVGAIRYDIDIDNAIATGELEVPDQYKPKVKPLVVEMKGAPLSVADELAKLKKLYDDGILTKEEYEAQKKKLLEQ
ncbi:MAG: SHOCT domain-containing protein [Chitinophagaceae bacterium]|nr:SHOCT domain-containing protein [Chitinophagaceae bacterium]MBP7108911.1 SHOCT domain-containing protein [Chitinophagaceae bacterium]MBP7314277.1 SHOCT domain-containing protein [Chitinophagaceae bacterium]